MNEDRYSFNEIDLSKFTMTSERELKAEECLNGYAITNHMTTGWAGIMRMLPYADPFPERCANNAYVKTRKGRAALARWMNSGLRLPEGFTHYERYSLGMENPYGIIKPFHKKD